MTHPDIIDDTPNLQLLFGEAFTPAFIKYADACKNRITVVTYRLGPVHFPTPSNFNDVLESLRRAARRGVRVSIFFSPWSIPARQRRAQARLQHSLQNAKCRLYPAAYNCRLHAKLYSFDDAVLILGSHNLTLSSLKSNGEISAVNLINGLPPALYQWLDAMTKPSRV